MKLVTLIANDRSFHIGALIPGATPAQNKILDFYAIEANSKHQNMVEFIKAEAETLPWAKGMIEKAKAGLVPASAFIFLPRRLCI
jgi:hypothetical protein